MTEYKGYIPNIEFDPDAGILHGEVVGIRDVVTFEGRSIEEVMQAFRDSVDDYLAFCVATGDTGGEIPAGAEIVDPGARQGPCRAS